MTHNFDTHPELTNRQMDLYYFQSPHKQIFEDFSARVVEVHDGDTVKLQWSERDFPFKLRMAKMAAPELKEKGGIESRDWLAALVLNQMVEIKIDPRNRVGKFGRLVGEMFFQGVSLVETSNTAGHSIPFGEIPMGMIKDSIKDTITKEGEI